jgi:hypothetical protein
MEFTESSKPAFILKKVGLLHQQIQNNVKNGILPARFTATRAQGCKRCFRIFIFGFTFLFFVSILNFPFLKWTQVRKVLEIRKKTGFPQYELADLPDVPTICLSPPPVADFSYLINEYFSHR